MTLQEAVHQGTNLLAQAGVGVPRLTAEVLLSSAIGCRREWLYSHATDELKELWWIHYGRYLHERLQGKPTQYITKVQDFYGRPFRVSPAVLIPRPETEHLVEEALKRIPHPQTPYHTLQSEAHPPEPRPNGAGEGPARRRHPFPSVQIIDVGTGSGAIAITLALETESHVYATDLSADALIVARENAAKLNAHVSFLRGDLLAGIPPNSMDIVVSNPPYIPLVEKDTLATEVRDYEPHLALFGGQDGLEIYRRLIAESAEVLRPSGHLLMELAYNGAPGVKGILETGLWESIEIIPDLAGHPRVIVARRSL